MGIYIAQGIDYIRRKEYEKSGFHIVVIDLIRNLPIRIICVYRSFRPTGISPIKFFDTQLGILKNALTSNCYILGDFNLDARMEGIDSYSYKLPLCNLTEFALNNKLQQIIEFCTWSRINNGVQKRVTSRPCLCH